MACFVNISILFEQIVRYFWHQSIKHYSGEKLLFLIR